MSISYSTLNEPNDLTKVRKQECKSDDCSETISNKKAKIEKVALDNFAQNIKIINAINYPKPEAAIRAIKEMSEKIDILYSEDYLAKEFSGNKKYNTLLAIKEDHTIVGFLSGKIKNECFSVKRLVVHENFRSSENNFSIEKIGTRLMLKAFEKAKLLGKKILTLKYDPGNTYYSALHRADCMRRVAFYDHFKKFLLNSSYIDETVYTLQDGSSPTIRNLSYYLTGFKYEKALDILGFPSDITHAY